MCEPLCCAASKEEHLSSSFCLCVQSQKTSFGMFSDLPISNKAQQNSVMDLRLHRPPFDLPQNCRRNSDLHSVSSDVSSLDSEVTEALDLSTKSKYPSSASEDMPVPNVIPHFWGRYLPIVDQFAEKMLQAQCKGVDIRAIQDFYKPTNLPPFHPALFGITHKLSLWNNLQMWPSREMLHQTQTYRKPTSIDSVINTLRKVKEREILPISMTSPNKAVTAELNQPCRESQAAVEADLFNLRCFVCSKVSGSASALQRHIRTHRQKPNHHCGHCGKNFRDQCTLLTHVRTHTGEKPYTCHTCGAKFRQSGTLRRHIKIHTGDKPYKCECCGKQFRHSSTLIIHRRIHTGENPHQCMICLKRFRQSGHLQKHIATHNH